MEWRCEWCGKPHENDDPPCDNCGHGSFERAVVPVAADRDTLGTESTVWVCTNCGREHTKHTPPCSRCGHDELERRRQQIDESEITAPGYLDLVTPRYIAAFLGVLALAAVFLLGVTGTVDIPGFGTGIPEVADVPGNATAAGGVSLADAERAYLQRLNDEREAADGEALTRTDELDRVATFLNQRRVKENDLSEREREAVRDVLREQCSESPQVPAIDIPTDRFDSATGLGESVFVTYQRDVVVGATGTATGVDFHARPSGDVAVVQIIC
jgi:ribosomal protein L37E